MFHKNPENPLISVVVPTLNEEKFIERTLVSLINQDFKNYELIVVDNNSLDRTAEIAERFGARVIFEPKAWVIADRLGLWLQRLLLLLLQMLI